MKSLTVTTETATEPFKLQSPAGICEYSQEWRLVRDYRALRYFRVGGRVAAVIARR